MVSMNTVVVSIDWQYLHITGKMQDTISWSLFSLGKLYACHVLSIWGHPFIHSIWDVHWLTISVTGNSRHHFYLTFLTLVKYTLVVNLGISFHTLNMRCPSTDNIYYRENEPKSPSCDVYARSLLGTSQKEVIITLITINLHFQRYKP